MVDHAVDPRDGNAYQCFVLDVEEGCADGDSHVPSTGDDFQHAAAVADVEHFVGVGKPHGLKPVVVLQILEGNQWGGGEYFQRDARAFGKRMVLRHDCQDGDIGREQMEVQQVALCELFQVAAFVMEFVHESQAVLARGDVLDAAAQSRFLEQVVCLVAGEFATEAQEVVQDNDREYA